MSDWLPLLDLQLEWLDVGPDLELASDDTVPRLLEAYVEEVGHTAAEFTATCSHLAGFPLLEDDCATATRDYSVALRFLSSEEAVFAELLDDG